MSVHIFALMVAVCMISTAALAAHEVYTFPADGFEIIFPSPATKNRIDHGERGYVNTYQSLNTDGSKKYSVFVNHGSGRVFADKSIDAYLKGLVKGITNGLDNASIATMEQVVFKGYPGIKYEITGTSDGLPVVSKGRAFIVDGDHIRLGIFYLNTPENRHADDDAFFESLQLIPVDGELSTKPHSDRAGTFFPPTEWSLSKSKTPPQITVVYVSKSGHSITVIDSQTPGYTCRSYEAELRSLGITSERGTVTAKGATFTSYKTTMFNKEAGTRMTNITYCADSQKGAVLLIGAAPEQTAFRSSKLFDKVARSFKPRK
jgi:hypothetical protein